MVQSCFFSLLRSQVAGRLRRLLRMRSGNIGEDARHSLPVGRDAVEPLTRTDQTLESRSLALDRRSGKTFVAARRRLALPELAFGVRNEILTPGSKSEEIRPLWSLHA